MTPTSTVTSGKQNELMITRTFDVSPDLAFEAWTKPEHLVHWWGPNDFALPFCDADFRTGGRYRLCMRSPEGEDHWVWGEYREIIKPERLVFTWNREDGEGRIWNSTVVFLTFDDVGGKTAFTLTQKVFNTVADRDDHRGGWAQCLDRLGTYLLSIKGTCTGNL